MHWKGIMNMELNSYKNKMNEELELPDGVTKKIDKCFSIFNEVLNSEGIINAIKAEVNLATKYGEVLPSDMINGTIVKGEEITAEARKEFKNKLKESWESKLSKMESSETSLGDSQKIQQFIDDFVIELTNALNELKDKLGKILSDMRYIKFFSTYYSKKH